MAPPDPGRSGRRNSSTSKSTSSTSTSLSSVQQHPLLTVTHLALKSAALVSLALGGLLVALAGWTVLRRATAVPTLAGRERVWLQHGEWRLPYAEVGLPTGKYDARGQEYDVALELQVPVNENNLQLGNFMVSLSLLGPSGERVVNAILTHPAISPSASFLRLINPFLLFCSRQTSSSAGSGAYLSAPGTQILVVPLLEASPLGSLPSPHAARWASRTTRVERVWLEVGRRDAHPAVMVVGEKGDAARRELQVYESWLRVETKLRGLRSILHTHPYISFAFFLPSFLFLELVAALAVYITYVASPPPPSPPGKSAAGEVYGISKRETPKTAVGASIKGEESAAEAETDGEGEDVKPLISPRLASEDEAVAEAARVRRLRLGPGGLGMSEVAGGESDEDDEDAVEPEEAVGEGLARQEEEELADLEGRESEEVGKWEEATVGGSETTFASSAARSFGPSLAATSTSSATTASQASRSGGAGLRERVAAGGAQGVIREEGEVEDGE
ncbi:hypothetical protein JCM10213_003567 [Rhodosporidiobolus nylandii]